MEKYKVVIIGCGIAGMSAAINLKRGGIEPLIIENNIPGGTLNHIPSIKNYPGYIDISGPDLAMNVYSQVNELNIKIKFMNISNIDLDKKIIDNQIEFDYLIIATGRKSKLLGIEKEEELIGRGVSTCALCDGMLYKDKDIVVVGDNNITLNESLYLSNLCKKITIITKKSSFSGNIIDKVNDTKNIDIIYNANVISYNTENNVLVSVTLDNNEIISTDGVFLALGRVLSSELFNVDKDNNYIVVNDKYETNIPYVYAIGDVIKKDYYQITTAVYDAVIAANNIIKKCNQIN